mmetsp:Transcript_12512/g.30423  ORF Transcript_12512/g.30423 Transcript_12512/m.30423 type:complete len:168 (+) Transcript_12512:216-719(+)|eukprot:CAMPEP_0178990858 /NCGR_PEP_ID=MMETSP0795-20121207/5199_1 /TAXON_ID=88552 /ORGANISM="Amoebophrya sp., Strain Ameob2" /LENGTH=167 /DNA_ID=CAMNT_0020682489 /DNA_START=216 /DNA_END=719 /DNA_ORIENTATION=-
MDFDNGANDQAEVMAILKQQKKILGEKKAKDAKEMKEKKQKQVQQTGNRSKRAGLMFPVGMIDRKLKEMGVAKRVGAGSSVFLAAVLEYLTAEVLELAGNTTSEQKKNRILPRHIQLAIHKDEELEKYLGNTTIAQGGVLPGIPAVLLPNGGNSTKKPAYHAAAEAE